MERPGGHERVVYVGVGLVFAILLLLYFVYKIQVVVLVFLLTLLLSIIVSGPVDYLAHRGVSRGWGTLIVLGGLTLALCLAGLAIAPTVADQSRELVEALPALLEDAQEPIRRLQGILGINIRYSLDPQGLLDAARNFLSGGTVSAVASVGAGVANVVSLGIVVLIATVYAVAQPERLVGGFVDLFPAERRGRVREILREMYWSVQRWFLGQLTSMTLIGVLSAILLSIIGVPFAVLIGLFSGLISFVPYVGPVASVVPPVLLTLFSGQPFDAVWVILAYMAIQALEGNLIQPLVMSRAVSLHPVAVIFALLTMGTLFGLVGLLLAVPLAAALHVLVRELWVERMDGMGTDPNPPPDRRALPARGPRLKIGRLWRAIRGRFRPS